MSQSDHMTESNDSDHIDKLVDIYYNTELRYWDWYWYQSLIVFLKVSHTVKSVTQLS